MWKLTVYRQYYIILNDSLSKFETWITLKLSSNTAKNKATKYLVSVPTNPYY